MLIIPHQPHRNVKVRAVEMARYLAGLGRYEVFLLTWELSTGTHQSFIGKVLAKSMEAWTTTRTRPQIIDDGGIRRVHLPYLLAPAPWCQRFNQRQIERFVQAQGIQSIISGNAYHFPMPQDTAIQRIYDVVDDHISPDSGPHWQRTRAFTLNELRKAEHSLTISHALQDVLAAEGFANSLRIPNGVDLSAFRQTSEADVRSIRERYELDGRFAIGYIGNHGWWGGMDLLLDAFDRLHARFPQSKLLIVGPGEDLERFRQNSAGRPEIVFTGPVPPTEIAAYFQAINFGVLPFQMCPFTDNALPLKILEYGAARKRVLATPLKELLTLGFPHVDLLKPDPGLWAEALAEEALAPTPWQADWDRVIAGYDWPVVLQPLPALLEGHYAPAV